MPAKQMFTRRERFEAWLDAMLMERSMAVATTMAFTALVVAAVLHVAGAPFTWPYIAVWAWCVIMAGAMTLVVSKT